MTYNILLVDDEMELLNIYKRILKRKKEYQVIDSAVNGEEAVEKVKNAHEKIDLVIMDHRMPIMDGLEATKEIIEHDGGIKVIFMSADDSVKEHAIKAGAVDFLKKPVRVMELLKNIDGVLNKG